MPTRLALVLHVAEGTSGEVNENVMNRAIGITEWAKNEIHRAYAILRPCEHDPALTPDQGRLLKLMARKGRLRVREAQAGCHAYRNKSALQTKADLDRLVASGHARQTPDGAYEYARAGSPAPATAPPTTAPTRPSADVADVLTGDGTWTKLE